MLFKGFNAAGDDAIKQLLDANDKLLTPLMPDGIGADTVALETTEALTSGDFINLYIDTDTAKVRLADRASGRAAHGYVIAAFAANATATIYPLAGNNGAVSTLTVGKKFLGAAGKTSATPPAETDTGHVFQNLGYATSPTNIRLSSDPAFVIV